MRPKLDIKEMLRYRRPARSKTEQKFIADYLDPVPGMYADRYGNRILTNDRSRIMISTHTDTVHREGGFQRVIERDGVLKLPQKSWSNCLGADDTAGVYAALRMIDAGVPATFVFHRDEESGGRGSRWLADQHMDWIEGFDICLALDRRGKTDIITSQWGERSASDAFAISLAQQLGMDHKPAAGVFTDSANYAYLISECSNISVGYANEHSTQESLDIHYLERLIDRLIAVDWSALEVKRDRYSEDSTYGLDDWNFDGVVKDDPVEPGICVQCGEPTTEVGDLDQDGLCEDCLDYICRN